VDEGFAADRIASQKFLRSDEVPMLPGIGIVIVVVVKPF
jgi:uncharacterized membrane protein